MLILKRDVGQAVILTIQDIEIRVLLTRTPTDSGGKLALGISAPQSVKIYREEKGTTVRIGRGSVSEFRITDRVHIEGRDNNDR